MKTLILAVLLASGLATTGCQAFTPGAAQSAAAVLNRDLAELRDVLATVTTDARILRTVGVIAANASAVDTLLNK